jgi:chromosome segregation ATPase
MFGKFRTEEERANALKGANDELLAKVTMLEAQMVDIVQNSADAAHQEIDERLHSEHRLQLKVDELEQELFESTAKLSAAQSEMAEIQNRMNANTAEDRSSEVRAAESTKALATIESERSGWDIRVAGAEREIVAFQEALNVACNESTTASAVEDGSTTNNGWRDQLALLVMRMNAQAASLQSAIQDQSAVVEQHDQLEVENQRLRGLAVDRETMLTRARGDAETISRATLQNKELKSRIAEIEDRFVELSMKSMQYASELETARFHAYGRGESGSAPATPTKKSALETLAAAAAPASSLTMVETPVNQSPTEPFDAETGEGFGFPVSEEVEEDGSTVEHEGPSFMPGPPASTGPPPHASLGEKVMHDDLLSQIQHLEMERNLLAAEVTELRAAAAGAQPIDDAVGSTDWPDWSADQPEPASSAKGESDARSPSPPPPPTAVAVATAATVVVTAAAAAATAVQPQPQALSGSAGENGNTLPLLPDGSRPNQDAMMQVAVIKLERELELVKDEMDELRARYGHVMAGKADLVKRLRLEEELTAQLACETDTIADYIALYHEHRKKSGEQMREKDTMLAEYGSQNELLEVELAEMRMVLAELCARLKATSEHAPEALRPGLIRIAADLHKPQFEAGEDGGVEVGASFNGGGMMSLAPTTRPPMIPDHMRLSMSYREL